MNYITYLYSARTDNLWLVFEHFLRMASFGICPKEIDFEERSEALINPPRHIRND